MQTTTQPAPPWLHRGGLAGAVDRWGTSKVSLHEAVANVLVVEDDPMLAEALKLRLEDVGVFVKTASTAAAARWNLLTTRFDAVVLDLGLPDGSGLDLMAQVSARVGLPPVIVLTGEETSDCEIAKSASAHLVLRKPCPHGVLAEAVLRIVGE